MCAVNTIFRFKEFPVYKAARIFRNEVKETSKEKFPPDERYVLRQQLWRALDSILLNIAQGADRHSDKDFSRFLNNAVGSMNEVIACLHCALDSSYIEKNIHEKYIQQGENIMRQLKAFLAKIRKDNKKF